MKFEKVKKFYIERQNRMIKIDLITGFLGSGKTTFLKSYARYLLDKGLNIGILENDFGAVNVDMMLLKDLEGEHCELEMISGGCCQDAHRRRFKTKLIAMGMCGYDRVLVEPSGIYDVEEFFDTLTEEPLDQWYEAGSVIAIVDAGLPGKMSEDADYLLASEIACAGTIVFSRAQETDESEIQKTKEHIHRALEKAGCQRDVEKDTLIKDWKELKEADFQQIQANGYYRESCGRPAGDGRAAFDSLSFLNLNLAEEQLREKAGTLFQSLEYGRVWRIKGFLKDQNGGWLECNATGKGMRTAPIQEGQQVVIVIGEGLNKEKIQEVLENSASPC